MWARSSVRFVEFNDRARLVIPVYMLCTPPVCWGGRCAVSSCVDVGADRWLVDQLPRKLFCCGEPPFCLFPGRAGFSEELGPPGGAKNASRKISKALWCPKRPGRICLRERNGVFENLPVCVFFEPGQIPVRRGLL